MRKLGIAGFLTALLFLFVAGCGQELAGTASPLVTSTTPANGAVAVPINQVLTATFNEALSPATINGTTFKVTGPGGVAVAGVVTYAATGSIASFTPSAALAYNTAYTATITTGVMDTIGNEPPSNYVWSFTTVTQPAVISTTPANGATGVPVQQVISATFSKTMNCVTLTSPATNFTVTGPGATAVAGTVSCSGTTASFTPTAVLAGNTTYTATITTAVTDTTGNPLAGNYVWTFTTAALPTVISTTPATGATGVLVNQPLTATFSKAMNCATLSSPATNFTVKGPGSTAVAGTVSCSGSTATFTPLVPLAYNTLYTATIGVGATDTGGNPLAGSYTWTFTTAVQPFVSSTTPASGATGVPVNQVLSATFSKAMNCATLSSPAANFTVSGPGAIPVVGTVTCNGTVATFTPAVALAYNSSYTATISTGATDTTGAPLANNYVWSFTTVAQPVVIATTPANGATGVPTNQAITVTFSKAMNCATLSSPATNFTVKGPGLLAVAGTVSCAGAVATFTPAAALATNTLFTATISTGATDSAGNSLAANYVWTFKTAVATAPPAVISTTPANGATGVPITQAITATFNNAMNPATINTTTFTVKGPGNTPVTGVVTYVAAGSVAIFTPVASLAPSTLYTATITTGAADLANNTLAANYVWSFTTATAPDTTKPTVVSTIPLNQAVAVPLNQVLSATFSEAMNAATINSTTFLLTGPGATPVAGQVAYASVGTTATFTPTVNLLPGILYTATITTGAADLSANTLASNYVWTFTTGALPDTTPPQIVSTIPINGAINVPTNQAISATFTEAMNPLTITTSTFLVTGPGATSVAGTVSYNPISFIATFTPTASLSGSYIANITSGATDLAGNPLGSTGAPNPWTFTTGAIVIPPPVDLGTAALFGGFGGGAGITNQGVFTVINGSIATTGVSTLITGFHDNGPNCIYTESPLNMGLVNGAIDTAPPPPTVGCPTEGTAITSAIAAKVAADALSAYNALAAFPGGLDVSVCPGCGGGSAGELGNRTLSPGIYKSAPGTYAITQGDLTLDAHGDVNAFWVFQAAAALTVGTPSFPRNVLLVNGAQAKNVFWQVGTAATINGILGGGTMMGTVIAQAGISVSTAGVVAITTVNGRLLVLTGPLTVVNTVINVPAP